MLFRQGVFLLQPIAILVSVFSPSLSCGQGNARPLRTLLWGGGRSKGQQHSEDRYEISLVN